MSDADAGGRGDWERVSTSTPCPVCKKIDWCLVAPDGSAAICAREESAKKCGDAGWLHLLTEPTPAPSESRPKSSATPPKDWGAKARKFAQNATPERREKLAVQLGLPTNALDVLPLLGFNPDDRVSPCFLFPEMDSAGKVIGLNRRWGKGRGVREPDGTTKDKMMMKGGKRGLTLPTGWRELPGPVFVVEGPTDTAAGVAAGIACVGRPSNSGGVELLAGLFRDWPADRDIVIVGENDRKPDGKWPGRDGAESVARGLAAILRRRVLWALPPADAKDVRDWLKAPARGEAPWPDRGRELVAHLTTNAVGIDPPEEPEKRSGPADGPNDGPDNPHRLAGGFLDTVTQGGPVRLLRFWRGEFHRYHGGAYQIVPDDDLRGELAEWVRSEFIRLNLIEMAGGRAKSGDKGPPPEVRKVTVALISNVLQALGGVCLLPAATDPPAWIDGATGPDPAGVVSVANGLLDLNALAHGRAGCLLAPSPSFFTPTAAPFAFDPSFPPPREWLQFLANIWPNDSESIACLQEWFGYLLTPDTRQQKILFLIGPKRAGKGTVSRVLGELVGTSNRAGPTLGSLATNFGLSPLLGKSVAVISDARLGGRADAAAITERLLAISGEDALTIDRKHRDPLTVKLNTRFVIISNELPRLRDTSGALAGRLILLRFTESWFGKEDHGLLDRLRVELPGILLWAVEGWRRLRDRGRFVQPSSGAGLIEDMEDLSSPVGAFVRWLCVVGPGFRVEVNELYRVWCGWCDDHGRKEPGIEETFGRDLRAAVPSIGRTRPRSSEGRLNLYTGIRLRTAADPDPDDPPDGRGGQGGHGDQPMHATGNKVEEEAHAEKEHAEEESADDSAVIGAMGGHGDHVDHPDQTRPRRRYRNDDRPHDVRP